MQLKNTFSIIFFLFFSSLVGAQQGTVSGVLNDDSGFPLPGVNISIKGTSIGTQTDFDGKYSIDCNVGDTLLFVFIGMETKEVVVTPSMFGNRTNNGLQFYQVNRIHSYAYEAALEKIKKEKNEAQSFRDTKITYNRDDYYFRSDRIKNIDITADKVRLDYFGKDVFFEIDYATTFGVQFVKDRNLPELQQIFSQGIPVSGALAFQGPETETIFSYGPTLNSLEFDGSNYPYDVNGQLVNAGNGNGIPANAYANNIFENVLYNSHQLNVNLSRGTRFFDIQFTKRNYKDIYDVERSATNRLKLRYKKNKYSSRYGWETFFIYENVRDNQPNINGFQNNLLVNLWATPPSFSNSQGFLLTDATQRRFSSQFNNPEWLLQTNRNAVKNTLVVAGFQNEIELSDVIFLKGKLNYKHADQTQKFGAVRGTAGFETGFASDKINTQNTLNIVGEFNHDKYSYNGLEIVSKADFTYQDLNFSLSEASGFTPFSFDNAENSIETTQKRSRSVLRWFNQVEYAIDGKISFTITNNSYYSSVQNDKWFLPTFHTEIDLQRIFNIHGAVRTLKISSIASKDVNDFPLYYTNLSHNSLLITPQESLGYTSNNDLFISKDIALEEIINFETGLSFGIRLEKGNINFDASYYYSKTEGSVFPVLNNGTFTSDNIADIKSSGVEFSINTDVELVRDVNYESKISFATYNTEVTKLYNDATRLPIAGFSTTSKNLIVGQPAGVIVGSVYLKNSEGNHVIGADGFPLVNSTPQIIGDPIPDFTIGIINKFSWKNLALEIVLDIQKGGDVWNGTQNVLNYLGTSQQSATERNITNFIFNGVNQQGSTNTIAVDFYNPANPITDNRFVRYGFEGVAEDAIEDASYINIKSISLSYRIHNKYDNDVFFRNFNIGLYAKNLFTWSKFNNNSPYGALYGNASAQELNFFNTPILSEIGFTLNIKI